MRSLLDRILDPFRDGARPAWAVIVAFALVNALVLANAVLHDPRIGYDSSAHLQYAATLAKGRLPTAKDTHEFFSPPLPYVPLATFRAALDVDAGGDAGDPAHADRREMLVLKLAQLVQVGYSIVLTFFVLKIARLARPGAFTAGCALLCLGLVPTYYRTFAMIRGEPLLATLAVVGTYLTLRTFAARRPTLGAAALIGLTLGAAVVSRQWAFFLLPALGAIGLWRLIVDAPNRWATLRAGAVTLAVFAIVAAPFYLHLQRTYGSVRAFNREPVVADVDEPASRRLGTRDALLALGVRPVRDVLDGHPLLLFHADVWGDYWQYFLVYATKDNGSFVTSGSVRQWFRRGRTASSNYATMPRYLGRLALVGTVPTLLFAVGTAGGLWAIRRAGRGDAASVVRPALALCVVGTIAGYAWFVASYPDDHGDTIKASYPLQLYAPLALLAAATLAGLRDRRPRAAWAIVGLLGCVAMHNAPACVTRYW